MATKEELMRLPLAKLMSLCRHVAEDPAHYTQSASEQAGTLMRECTLLQAAHSPEGDVQLWALEKRVAEFLAQIL